LILKIEKPREQSRGFLLGNCEFSGSDRTAPVTLISMVWLFFTLIFGGQVHAAEVAPNETNVSLADSSPIYESQFSRSSAIKNSYPSISESGMTPEEVSEALGQHPYETAQQILIHPGAQLQFYL
jgi:hypothetical protein